MSYLSRKEIGETKALPEPTLKDKYVLLVNPPWEFSDSKTIIVRSAVKERCYPPLGLALLAGYLEKCGARVKIVDLQAEKDALESLDSSEPPDFVGITATTVLIESAYSTAESLKRLWPETRVVFGGIHPTMRPREVLENPWVDYVIKGEGERSLARLAGIVGDKEMATRRRLRMEKGIKAMRGHMWDREAGTFLSVKRDTLEKIPVATIGSWIPLAAGVPTKAMARRMAEVLASPAWMTPLPVPTVDRTDKRWKSSAFWRGDVWPPTNYQIASGLAAYGHKNLAAVIADKTIANAISNGISEHYDSVSGRALGVPDDCMSCTLVTMMLDGLTQKHRLKLVRNRM